MKKHEVNIKKSKLIDLQIAIIALLCFGYVMYNVFFIPNNEKKQIASTYTEPEEAMGPYVMWEPEQPKVNTVVKKVEKILEQPKTPEVIKTPIAVLPTEPTTKSVVENPNEKLSTPTSEPVSTSPLTNNNNNNNNNNTAATNTGVTKLHYKHTVDVLPVFPGCHKYSTNSELANCFQEKVKRIILRKFDNGLGDELGLTGIQRIHLYFEIDENGNVSNIRVKNKHPELVEEAKRVAKLLPKMEPARSGNHKVKMAYNIPITFDVR